jgi:hypothetical protein
MKLGHLPKKIAGLILGFILLLGIGVGSNTTLHAQDRTREGDQNRRDRNWDRYGNYGGSVELRQTALNAGYNEGIREGNNVRQNGRRSNYRDSNTYRKATKDYSSRLGDRELYQRYFREGFESGYNAQDNAQGSRVGDDRYRNNDRNDNGRQHRRGRNWDDYGNNGGSSQLRQTALNAGYNEGIKQGHNDRNKRNSKSYQDKSTYQKATKDYNSRLGDRELYQRYFRAAYESGYSDGVNGY